MWNKMESYWRRRENTHLCIHTFLWLLLFERQRDTEVFHPLVHSLNAINDQGLKSGGQKLFQLSYMGGRKSMS